MSNLYHLKVAWDKKLKKQKQGRMVCSNVLFVFDVLVKIVSFLSDEINLDACFYLKIMQQKQLCLGTGPTTVPSRHLSRRSWTTAAEAENPRVPGWHLTSQHGAGYWSPQRSPAQQGSNWQFFFFQIDRRFLPTVV